MSDSIRRSLRQSVNVSILCQALGIVAGISFRKFAEEYGLADDFGGPHVWACLLAVLHGMAAWSLSSIFKLTVPWRVLNLLLAPCFVLVVEFDVPGWILLAAAALSVLLYLPTVWTSVPYYPSSKEMYKAVEDILPQAGAFSFIDLGCGTGGLLAYLAKHRPLGNYLGVEISPLAFFICKLRFLFRRNVSIHFKSFWKTDISKADFVYTFLAPPPMAQVWEKVKKEMKKGSTYLNNSFEVPVKAQRVIEVRDARDCRLFVHRM